MKILIVEDEQPAARQLIKLLKQLDANITIIETLDSVEATVAWLKTFPAPDAIFLDIQIADGLSFDIFRQVDIVSPVVFTTAFDQYAIKAFRVNAVDYLLKPIDTDELATVIEKIRVALKNKHNTPTHPPEIFQNLIAQFSKPTHYRERFLVKTGQTFLPIEVTEVAYFFSEDSLTHLITCQNRKHLLENTLDELEAVAHPQKFFRINRKILVSFPAIQKISPHFNGRLKLELQPNYAEEVFVARERVGDFKMWLGA